MWWRHFGAERELRLLAGRDPPAPPSRCCRSTSTAPGPCACCASSATAPADQLGPGVRPRRPRARGRGPPAAAGRPALARRPAGGRPPERSRGLERAHRGHRPARRAQPHAGDRRPDLGRVPRLEEQELPRPGAAPRAQAGQEPRALLPAERRRTARRGHGHPAAAALGPLGGRVRRLRARARGVPPRVRRRGPRARLAATLARRGGRDARWRPGTGCATRVASASTSRAATRRGTSIPSASCCSRTSIRSAFEDGMREYRFLRGGDAYKGRFADADPGVETMVLGRGSLGRPAVAAAGALGRLPRGDRLLARANCGSARFTSPRPRACGSARGGSPRSIPRAGGTRPGGEAGARPG